MAKVSPSVTDSHILHCIFVLTPFLSERLCGRPDCYEPREARPYPLDHIIVACFVHSFCLSVELYDPGGFRLTHRCGKDIYQHFISLVVSGVALRN